MEHPFIIWTLRRTGGTTLASVLRHMAGDVRILHEPFNKPRQFGDATRSFEETGDADALDAAIRSSLDTRVSIKHCVDLLPVALHRALVREAREAGYNSVVLDRRDEGARIFSLALAQQTSVWGADAADKVYAEIRSGKRRLEPVDTKKLDGMIRMGRDRRAALFDMLTSAGDAPPVLFFEDLYKDAESARARILSLCDHFGIRGDLVQRLQGAFDSVLKTSPQNSQSMMALVPNMDEVRPLLEAANDWDNPLSDLPSLALPSR